jgi:hypothetical protein
MDNLSEDDLNLKDMTPEELAAAWDLWFDLAQATNDFDPPYTHGVFVPLESIPSAEDGKDQTGTGATRGGAGSRSSAGPASSVRVEGLMAFGFVRSRGHRSVGQSSEDAGQARLSAERRGAHPVDVDQPMFVVRLHRAGPQSPGKEDDRPPAERLCRGSS